MRESTGARRRTAAAGRCFALGRARARGFSSIARNMDGSPMIFPVKKKAVESPGGGQKEGIGTTATSASPGDDMENFSSRKPAVASQRKFGRRRWRRTTPWPARPASGPSGSAGTSLPVAIATHGVRDPRSISNSSFVSCISSVAEDCCCCCSAMIGGRPHRCLLLLLKEICCCYLSVA
jgi:hypothetical protein